MGRARAGGRRPVAGVRIHRCRPQIVRARALVSDDIVYIGSSNLDVRSLPINCELLLPRGGGADAA